MKTLLISLLGLGLVACQAEPGANVRDTIADEIADRCFAINTPAGAVDEPFASKAEGHRFGVTVLDCIIEAKRTAGIATVPSEADLDGETDEIYRQIDEDNAADEWDAEQRESNQ
jgi:hypothetical protein